MCNKYKLVRFIAFKYYQMYLDTKHDVIAQVVKGLVDKVGILGSNPQNCILYLSIGKFYEEKCAMVIGSYKLTDFNMNEIPPGIIDHKEWTDNNGHNNALRINGLGAPRAFYIPIIRKIKFPNVSYGEDYSVALAISRE